MTAGSGIVHSEEPSDRIKIDGGVMHGLQLWINLPKERKMSRPSLSRTEKREYPPDRSTLRQYLAKSNIR